MRRPLFTFNFATERFGLPPEALPLAGCFASSGAEFFAPRLEKFHFAPSSDLTSPISGWFNVNSVTFSVFEKISGIISTPTFSDFACTNGDWLNEGSSAIEMSSALTLPENNESDRFPTFTGRPSAVVNSASSFGRNVFASTNNGNAIATTIKTPTTMARIFRTRLMTPTSCRNGSRNYGVKNCSSKTLGSRWRMNLQSAIVSPLRRRRLLARICHRPARPKSKTKHRPVIRALDTGFTLCCSVRQCSL